MAKITDEFRISALRRGIVVRPAKAKPAEEHIVNAATLEMANLGFLVSPEELKPMSTSALTAMLKDARAIIGADRAMDPIYPGFPKQVQELGTLTLFMEQILHYWTGGEFLPNYPTVVREGLPLEDMLRSARKVEVLPAADTARKLIRKLANDGVALSEDDRAILMGSVELQLPTLELVSELAKSARHGENLQSFLKAVHIVGSYAPSDLLAAAIPGVGNSDQLLRAVLAVLTKPTDEKWEKNYMLAVDTLANRHARAIRMLKINRATRRAIVQRLGELTEGFKADRLVTRRALWRRVMTAVHPYDFKLTEAEKRAVDIIHSNIEYRTINSLVEEAMEKGNVKAAVKLMKEHQPGNLLTRLVALLRLVDSKDDAKMLAKAVRKFGAGSPLSTLISAHNGVLSANDENARVTRVAGLTNTIVDRKGVVKIKDAYLKLVLEGLREAMTVAVKSKPAVMPARVSSTVMAPVSLAVPLVKRDAATADRALDRGQELAAAGDGDVVRIFSHWTNAMLDAGFMDVSVTILDEALIGVSGCGWNSWGGSRDWATYSGDKLVQHGDSAAEFVDVDLRALRKALPTAEWAVMAINSYSGWPMNAVDIIAGVMLRSDADKGETFDARSVTSAFKPTTEATQSVPLAVNVKTGKAFWLDSSNGSTNAYESAANDDTLGSIVYDELLRPRFTMGDLASVWAAAHGTEFTADEVDRDFMLSLLS